MGRNGKEVMGWGRERGEVCCEEGRTGAGVEGSVTGVLFTSVLLPMMTEGVIPLLIYI